jgi:glycosyltransferase involved in cell wall biosynthesis
MTTADPTRAEIDLRTGAEPARLDADQPRLELDQTRLDVDRARLEVDRARLDVDRARLEVDQVDPLRVEVDLLRVEADRLSAEVDPLRSAGLLVVAVNYAPEQIGFAPRSTAMARDLAAIAARVTVLTAAPDEPVRGLARIPGQSRRSTDQEQGVQLIRHSYRQPRSGGSRRVRYEHGFLRAALRTPIRDTPDLVIGVLPAVGAGVAAARIAQRFRVPLLLMVHDVVAPRNRDGGLTGSSIARGQAEALRQASRVVLVGTGLRAAVIALGVDKARIDVLADWTPSLPVKQEPVTARARLGITPDQLVVLHVGNIGPGQDVSTLVRAARRIVGQTRQSQQVGQPAKPLTGAGSLQVLLVGEGSQREELRNASADLPSVRFLAPVSGGDYPGLLSAADVMVVTEPVGRPDRTLPSRLESYLRAGRPVVAAVNPDGEAERALRSVPGAVLVVPPGDPGALASVLIRLRDDETERTRLREAARGYADAGLTGTVTARGLRDVVRSALIARVR